MLRQRRCRQLGALLEAQLDVDATRIVIALPRRCVSGAKCSVSIAGSKMDVSCRHLDGVATPSVKKSAKHTESNPQSTNIVVKCPECDEFKWSYAFERHWNQHHKQSKGNMPGPMETAITVSKMERGFFQRGQKKLAKKRGKGSSGIGKKKAKKAKDIVPEGNHTVAGTH